MKSPRTRLRQLLVDRIHYTPPKAYAVDIAHIIQFIGLHRDQSTNIGTVLLDQHARNQINIGFYQHQKPPNFQAFYYRPR